MLKDVRLCLEAAGEAAVDFPAARETERVLAQASAQGLGDADFAALLDTLEQAAARRL